MSNPNENDPIPKELWEKFKNRTAAAGHDTKDDVSLSEMLTDYAGDLRRKIDSRRRMRTRALYVIGAAAILGTPFLGAAYGFDLAVAAIGLFAATEPGIKSLTALERMILDNLPADDRKPSPPSDAPTISPLLRPFSMREQLTGKAARQNTRLLPAGVRGLAARFKPSGPFS